MTGTTIGVFAPSLASELDFKLYETLLEDKNLSPYVEAIDENFSAEEFCSRLNGLLGSAGVARKVKADALSLEKMFVEFQRLCFGGEAVNATTQVSIFIKSLLNDDSMYLHPKRHNVIVWEEMNSRGGTETKSYPSAGTKSAGATFDSAGLELFFTRFERDGYSLAERKAITECADVLISDFERRFNGDFWTPQVLVDEAHAMMTEQLGEGWRDKFAVWDPAAGTLNLTRDHRFGKLFSSTIHQDELNIAEAYNPEGTKFQYDFLNDDMVLHAASPAQLADPDAHRNLGLKMPEELFETFRSKSPLLFMGNPPYGQATDQDGAKKKGIASTAVAELMKKEGMGHASGELYTQFIYRVQMLAKTFGYEKDFFFFFFNKGFLTSPSFENFTNKLCSQFQFERGFMVNADEFKGTSDAWGIIFSQWSLSKTAYKPETFDFTVKRSNPETGFLEDISEWQGRAVGKDNTISTVISKPTGERLSLSEFSTTKNGIDGGTGKVSGSMLTDSFGYLHNASNNIQFSDKYTGMYSICFNNGHGTPVDAGNLLQAATVFSIRKSALPKIKEEKVLWVRDKDIFPAPSEDFMNDFAMDCLVYSLFASGSNQTSLRDYIYGTDDNNAPKIWRIENQFFPLSREVVRSFAIKHNNIDIERDLDTDTERYVAQLLQTARDNGDLSTEAENLLSLFEKIFENSFKYRKIHALEQPKLNLGAWDAGWLQIYKMCFSVGGKEKTALRAALADSSLQQLHEDFKKARRVLGDKIAGAYHDDTGF